MNLIQTARKGAGRQAVRRQGDSRFRAGRHRDRQRQGGRRRAHPHPGLRGRLHRPLRRAACNENFTVRKISYGEGVERVFPLLFADDRLDQGRAPRQGAPRQAVLSARPARQAGAHRRGQRTTAARRRGRAPPGVGVSQSQGTKGRLFGLFVVSSATAGCAVQLVAMSRPDAGYIRPVMVPSLSGSCLAITCRLPWRFFGRLTARAGRTLIA